MEFMIMYLKRTLAFLLPLVTSITTCIAMQDYMPLYDTTKNHLSQHQSSSYQSLGTLQELDNLVSSLSASNGHFGAAAAVTTPSPASQTVEQTPITGTPQPQYATLTMAPQPLQASTVHITLQDNPLSLALYILRCAHYAISEHPIPSKVPDWIAKDRQLAQLYPSYENAKNVISSIHEQYGACKGAIGIGIAQQWTSELSSFKTILTQYENALIDNYGCLSGYGSQEICQHVQEIKQLQNIAANLELQITAKLCSNKTARAAQWKALSEQYAHRSAQFIQKQIARITDDCQTSLSDLQVQRQRLDRDVQVLDQARQHVEDYNQSYWRQWAECVNTRITHADDLTAIETLPAAITEDIAQLRTTERRHESDTLVKAALHSLLAQRMATDARPYMHAVANNTVNLSSAAMQQSKAAYDALKAAAMTAEEFHEDFASVNLEDLKAEEAYCKGQIIAYNRFVIDNLADIACLNLTIAEKQVAFEHGIATVKLQTLCNSAFDLDKILLTGGVQLPGNIEEQKAARLQTLTEMENVRHAEIAKRALPAPSESGIILSQSGYQEALTDMVLSTAALQNAAVKQQTLGNQDFANELWGYAQHGAECVKAFGAAALQGLHKGTQPFTFKLPQFPLPKASGLPQNYDATSQPMLVACSEHDSYAREVCSKLGYELGRLLPTVAHIIIMHKADSNSSSGGPFSIQPGGIIAALEKAVLPAAIPVPTTGVISSSKALSKAGNALSENCAPQPPQGSENKAAAEIKEPAVEQEKPAAGPVAEQAASAAKQATQTDQAPSKTKGSYCNDNGKAFEDFLQKTHGGTGSFKVTSAKYGTREFDGAYENTWYEAKFGKALENILSSDLEGFKKDMGKGLKIAMENNVKYELHSNVVIPQAIKEWCAKKGIECVEWLSFKL